MSRNLTLFVTASALALAGCTKAPPEDLQPAELDEPLRPAPLPDPLEPRPFEMPGTERHTLDNGLEVVLVPNDALPVWDMRLLSRVGTFADPEGQEGLVSATFEMATEGAGELSSAELARELQKLGTRVSGQASSDGSGLYASGLTRNLEPSLDLFAKVLLEPAFPEREWEVLRRNRIADLRANREDPSAISMRVYERVMWQDGYRGPAPTPKTYNAITTDDMRDFYERALTPEDALLLVGGAVDAETLLPKLEARLGEWTAPASAPEVPDIELHVPDEPVLYLVDRPGSAQSVLRVVTQAGHETDEDSMALRIANAAFGGSFMSRINLNLREDKGYTYGARCSVHFGLGPGVWVCGTSVETSVTAASIHEIQGEIARLLDDEPLTEHEIEDLKSREIHGFPMRYQTFQSVLGEQSRLWRYKLPEDWPERHVPRAKQVTTQGANAALQERLGTEQLAWIVVGDKDEVLEDIEELGFDVRELDRDGFPVEEG